ncbi:putative dna primase large subunit [Phaeomoniella chlamydospora]|uniref:Putative dna primase large subunit n=1 Tax=Phaeomoniella chlamydospora TaxID=158046 RepID=A0A0G2GNN3_PHACM|nr:putative dna primase large subunit [Phaeomoniella chlamydospora]
MFAEDLRKQGNEFYKKLQLPKAISLYIQASELEPTNPLPLSNLSAAYFEAGDYDKCIDAAVKCLTLISVDDALYEKVKSRQLQACVYAHQTDAVSHPANYPILAVWTDLLESEASFQYSESNMQDCRQRLFREIPIIKPSLRTELEYHPFGHDEPESLVDKTLFSVVENADISLLFGGIGDARNLFATLTEIAWTEAETPSNRSYHITINDIKPAAIARDLVVFFLLNELLPLGKDPKKALVVMNTLHFVYSAPIMPQLASKHLQKTIHMVIQAIEESSLPSWISLRPGVGEELLPILRRWIGDTSTLFPTEDIIIGTV